MPDEPTDFEQLATRPYPRICGCSEYLAEPVALRGRKADGRLLVSPIYFEQLAFDDPMAGRRSCTTSPSLIRTGNCYDPVVHGAISMKNEMFVLYALINNGGFSPMTDQRLCVVRRLAAFLKSDDAWSAGGAEKARKKQAAGSANHFDWAKTLSIGILVEEPFLLPILIGTGAGSSPIRPSRGLGRIGQIRPAHKLRSPVAAPRDQPSRNR